MNVTLLEQVRDYIETHPKEYKQGSWCGTKCCIAGHAVLLSGEFTRDDINSANATIKGKPVSDVAARLLELSALEAELLFLEWPEGYEDGWCYDPKFSVPAAVARINHFIETDGAE